MSIEFRVRIPRSAEKLFRNTVSFIEGVQILETHEEVRRLLENHRQFIASLRESKPQELQSKIDAGYRQLLEEVFRYENHVISYTGKKVVPSQDLDLSRFKEVVDEFFQKSIEDQYSGSVFATEVQVLVLRYGLKDGELRNYKQVAGILGRSYSFANSTTHSAFMRIFRSLSDKGLVVTSHY